MVVVKDIYLTVKAVDLYEDQMLSLSWLMEDYSGVSGSDCMVEPLK